LPVKNYLSEISQPSMDFQVEVGHDAGKCR